MFQPVVPLTGLAGWQFLQRTLPAQQEAFTESTTVKRDVEYFRENISSITTGEALVADRQLLRVALGAFGLDDDISSKAFIQQILDGGTNDSGALANRLADSRYTSFSEAFGFGNFAPRTGLSFFADEIIERFEAKQFQIAVGEQDTAMRHGLNLKSELAEIAAAETSNDVKWFSIMGNTAVRAVFETALGFPSSFGALDLDQQLEEFKERAQTVFGTDQVADLAEPELEADLIRLFLVRDEITNSQVSQSGGSTALTLLQSVPRLF